MSNIMPPTSFLLHHHCLIKFALEPSPFFIASSLFNDIGTGSHGDIHLCVHLCFLEHHRHHDHHHHHHHGENVPEQPPERREVDMKTRTREPVLPCNPEKYCKCLNVQNATLKKIENVYIGQMYSNV